MKTQQYMLSERYSFLCLSLYFKPVTLYRVVIRNIPRDRHCFLFNSLFTFCNMQQHNKNQCNCNWITLLQSLYGDTQGFRINIRVIMLRIRKVWSRVFWAEKYLWKPSKSVFVLGKMWTLYNTIIVIMCIVILRRPDVL